MHCESDDTMKLDFDIEFHLHYLIGTKRHSSYVMTL